MAHGIPADSGQHGICARISCGTPIIKGPDTEVSGPFPMRWAQKTAVYGILHHHTRQLLLGGFNHAPLILSYEIIIYKGTAASLPDHLFTGLSSRIMWIELNQMCGISAFVFHGTQASNANDFWTIDGSVHGNLPPTFYPDGDCHAGTCHRILNLTN